MALGGERWLARISVVAPVALLLACRPGAEDRTSLGSGAAAAATVPVAVSVPPLAWLADAVGGDRVTVTVLLPPGSMPETFEPTPRQMLELSRARVVLVVGHSAFSFEERLLRSRMAQAGAEDEAQVVRTEGASRDEAPDRQRGPASDPHLWLSPPVMAATARQLASALARVDPDGASLYPSRLAETLAEVERVEADAGRLLASRESRRFLVLHPAWGSFAAHFGLEQVAIEEEGKEPSPSRLARLVQEARRDQVRSLFVQRGFSRRSAEVLAAEVGAQVIELDPLGRDWPAMMLETARALAEH